MPLCFCSELRRSTLYPIYLDKFIYDGSDGSDKIAGSNRLCSEIYKVAYLTLNIQPPS